MINASVYMHVCSCALPQVHQTVIHLCQPDSLELRGPQVMFQSTALQGQAGLSQNCRLHNDNSFTNFLYVVV